MPLDLLIVIMIFCTFLLLGSLASLVSDAIDATPGVVAIIVILILFGLSAWLCVSNNECEVQHKGIVELISYDSHQSIVVEGKAYNLTKAFGKFFPKTTKFYVIKKGRSGAGIRWGEDYYIVTPLNENLQTEGNEFENIKIKNGTTLNTKTLPEKQ